MLEVNLTAMRQLLEGLDYRPLFVTVSGAHLYGFPSADSDVDLRGCHQLSLRDVVWLDVPNQTLERKRDHDCTLIAEFRLSRPLHEVARAVLFPAAAPLPIPS
jgi:predicted nucleotidyltransferase